MDEDKIEFVGDSLPDRGVTFTTGIYPNTTEMLRIAPDGFYVRGVKLEQDAAEARKVYEAFADWCRAQGIRW